MNCWYFSCLKFLVVSTLLWANLFATETEEEKRPEDPVGTPPKSSKLTEVSSPWSNQSAPGLSPDSGSKGTSAVKTTKALDSTPPHYRGEEGSLTASPQAARSGTTITPERQEVLRNFATQIPTTLRAEMLHNVTQEEKEFLFAEARGMVPYNGFICVFSETPDPFNPHSSVCRITKIPMRTPR